MENVNEIAKYLAKSISDCQILDLADLESKITAALIIASPPETRKTREVRKLQNKLGTSNADQKSKNIMYNLQVSYWKKKACENLAEWQKRECYDELDKILIENGCEVKR